ncbi:MAG: VWA domain-containing protein [Akkermansiaceae bacterium]|nr:VWA domain-containing protein [Akkermansiaceae bacterium]
MRSQSDSWNAERYGALVDPSWENPADTPLSTFSIDVDTASYSNIRRMIREGRTIPADAVRIEECINAFDYHDVPPAGDEAFAVRTALTTCPWNERHALVKIGIKGREIPRDQRPASNLVFLIDVSGSMQDSNKLPLVKECLKLLLHQLDERDSVSFVVYAGSEGVVLPPTKMTETGRVRALDSLEKLEAGGSTNGGAGIMRAYQMAMDNFVDGGVNRVILATDGDFNVGITGQQSLVDLVKERAARKIYLSVLGFGTGNLNDSMLEAIGKDGNGNHFYIDGIREGRKVFLRNLSGTLVTIAKDVKIQVEFNPAKVGSYRLIGYANRVLKNEDFNNDKVDAGDIGAGHTVTAFYEITPAGADGPVSRGVDPLKYQSDRRTETPAAEVAGSNEWLTLKLRHKRPDGDTSVKQESVVTGDPVRWQDADSNIRFATAVALFGMKLRGMSEVADITWNRVREIAGSAGDEDRAEFLELVRTLGGTER